MTKKDRVEIIVIIILLTVFVALIAPFITRFAEKVRVTRAKVVLKHLFMAEAMYNGTWARYTDNVGVLTAEASDLADLITDKEWVLSLESDSHSFLATLIRDTGNPDYREKTLFIDQTGVISGSHQYR